MGAPNMLRRLTSYGNGPNGADSDSSSEALLGGSAPARSPIDYEKVSDAGAEGSMPRRRKESKLPKILATLVLGVVGFWTVISLLDGVTSHVSSPTIPSPHPVTLPHHYTDATVHSPRSVTNSTWGFGKIYALNLARRPDKKDMLTLMAKASGMKVEFHHPVPGDELQESALPPHGTGKTVGEAGCYRGHADLWRKILEGEEESVLIVEDDVDWEVDWRAALERLVMPFATLLTSENKDGWVRTPSEADPWSAKDWDLLFLGACTERPLGVGSHTNPPGIDFAHLPGVIYNDTSVSHADAWSKSFKSVVANFGGVLPSWDSPVAERQRLIARSAFPVCTGSYAMTKRGAARALYHANMRLDAVDVTLSEAVWAGLLKSYTVVPSLISQYKVEKTTVESGRTSSNSDIHRLDSAKGGEPKETLAEALTHDRWFNLEDGQSIDRLHSMRKNLRSGIFNLSSDASLWP